MALPKAFDERIRRQLGNEYEDYIRCFDSGMYHGIRINTSKISVEDFLAISPFELEPVLWTKNGFYYDPKECTPSKHPYYYAGLYYIQEPSAMTPASVLDISKGDVVLDICAAPGGKSTELAAKLCGTGMLISNDISNSRAKALLKNLELFGIGNMCVVSEPPNNLSKAFPETFDKILIDAPCSGEGMFRKSQSMMTAWENNGTEMFSKLQRGIVSEAVKMLKPGGRLVYSTCTFSPEEDEQTVEYMLSHNDGMRLISFDKYELFDDGNPRWGLSGSPELTRCARLWPHHLKGEGHFIAMFSKEAAGGSEGSCSSYSFTPYKPGDDFLDFWRHVAKTSGIDTGRIEKNKDRLYYIPEKMPDVRGLRLLRHGLFLGEIKKNRFEPSQSLAMYLRSADFDNTVSFRADDIRVIKYLKGETVEAYDKQPTNGYTLVCVDGYPLGWAKSNGNTLKNKYLSGWRMMS